MKNNILILVTILVCLFALFLANAAAHCDTLDGPVIMAAKKALDTDNVNLVLIWVLETDEAQIREAFNKTLLVRKLGSDAKDLADMYL